MRTRQRLWVSAVAGLVAASIIVAADMPLPMDDVFAAHDEVLVAVPLGRVGDAATYERSEAWAYEGKGGRTNDTYDWVSGLYVDKVVEVADQAGVAHRTVRVVTDRQEGNDSIPTTELAKYLDLGTRDVLRQEWAYNRTPADSPGWTEQVAVVRVGPRWIPTNSGYNEVGPLSEADGYLGLHESNVRYQGNSYQAGQELLEELGFVLEAEARTGGQADVRNVTARVAECHMAEAGEYCVLEFRRVTETPGAGPSDTPGSAWSVVDEQWQVWVSSEFPYPVQSKWFERSWGQTERGDPYESWYWYNETMVGFRAGLDEIPWTPAPEARDYPLRNEDAERSPEGARHPTGGSGSRLALPFTLAYDMVLQDATLVRFQAWRAANPGAQLVGLLYVGENWRPEVCQSQGFNPSPATGWDFIFAAPGAEGFGVAVGRSAGAEPRTLERGTVSFDYDLDTTRTYLQVEELLPDRAVTLAAAERLWALSWVDDDVPASPDIISWGFYRTDCDQMSALTKGKTDLSALGTPYRMRTVRVAWTDSVEFVPARFTAPLHYYTRSVTVDLDSGFVVAGEATSRRGPSNVHYFVNTMPGGAAAALSASPASIPVDLAQFTTGVLALSLWAVLVAAVLYPTLRFLTSSFAGVLRARRAGASGGLLAHPLRAALMSAIQQDPGISPPKLQRLTGAGWSTVTHHVQVLERGGLVTSRVEGRHKHLFSASAVDRRSMGALAKLRNANTRAAYEIIHAVPGIGQKRLASHLGITVPGALWHLRRLQSAGLIVTTKAMGRVSYDVARAAPGLDLATPGRRARVRGRRRAESGRGSSSSS